jgi:hypothetical protein
MRVFIGFKYKTGGENPEEKHVPVMYGDLSRQTANIIKENSENKMLTVPRISCYISSIEMDTSRLADASFVSKFNIRERAYDVVEGERQYKTTQGANYTIERLMPTPFKLGLKADIWTSNTDQKLQLFEQIMVLFNPSLEIQTTDNYIDWTSLSVLDVTGITFSSRTIPQGADTEIDILTLDFSTPIWLSPPVKVKKLGIVKNIISNVFTEQGDILGLNDLVYNGSAPNSSGSKTLDNYGVLLMKNPSTGYYDCSVLDVNEAVDALALEDVKRHGSKRFDWNMVLELHGGYTGTSRIHFLQPNGYEISGTFAINEVDPNFLVVDLDMDTVPTNTESAITAIVNPYTFNPIRKFGSREKIPVGTKYLMLDDVNNSPNVGQSFGRPSDDSVATMYDGPDAWKDLDGNDPVIKANSIIEWSGSKWQQVFDPTAEDIRYVTNLTTGIQYKWENGQWLKSFEGEYSAGYWRFELDA